MVILGKCWENTKRIVNVDRECCHEHHEHGHVGPILPYCILLHSGNCLFRMLFFAVISSHPGVMKSIYLCFPLRSIKGWQNKAQRTSREDPVDVAAQCFFVYLDLKYSGERFTSTSHLCWLNFELWYPHEKWCGFNQACLQANLQCCLLNRGVFSHRNAATNRESSVLAGAFWV